MGGFPHLSGVHARSLLLVWGDNEGGEAAIGREVMEIGLEVGEACVELGVNSNEVGVESGLLWLIRLMVVATMTTTMIMMIMMLTTRMVIMMVEVAMVCGREKQNRMKKERQSLHALAPDRLPLRSG